MLLICINSYSQNLIPLKFEEVIVQEGKSSTDIYRDIRVWFSRTFISSNSVIQYNDIAKEIVSNGIFNVTIGNLSCYAASGSVRYNVTIKIKDGRFKIIIDNFIHYSNHKSFSQQWSLGLLYEKLPDDLDTLPFKISLSKNQFRSAYEKIIPKCYDENKILIKSLKDYLSTCKKDNDNW